MPITIAIVGGGFSGAITAIHLIRETKVPLCIDIIETRPQLGAGLAYSTRHPEHRLNVPAQRMTLFDENPTHFHTWFVGAGLDRLDRACDGGNGNLFAARSVFAQYMQVLLNQTLSGAEPSCGVIHHRSCAVDIEADRQRRWRVLLANGNAVTADAVIVCIGHTRSAPPDPFNRDTLADTGRVLTDPWDAEAIARFGSSARILVLGQGLTMGDVMATLVERGHRGSVVALSRRGLLARPYTDNLKTPVPFETLADDVRASAVLRLIRRSCDEAVRSGHSWHSVIETTREKGGDLWRRLSVGEQRRLVRHARPWWDAHRYRMAPQVAQAIDQALAKGRLRLLAGRAVRAEAARDGIDVTIRLRRAKAGEQLAHGRFDVVVSCVGPTHDVETLDNPFIKALLARGLARPHPTRLGFALGRDNQLVGESGDTRGVHVVGPLSRGACGDIVGVPEISRQARSLARELLGRPDYVGEAETGAPVRLSVAS